MWGVLSIVSVSVEGEGFGKDGVQTLPIHRIVLERSKSPDLRPKGAKAGRVGFEPTICGSPHEPRLTFGNGSVLSPGSIDWQKLTSTLTDRLQNGRNNNIEEVHDDMRMCY